MTARSASTIRASGRRCSWLARAITRACRAWVRHCQKLGGAASWARGCRAQAAGVQARAQQRDVRVRQHAGRREPRPAKRRRGIGPPAAWRRRAAFIGDQAAHAVAVEGEREVAVVAKGRHQVVGAPRGCRAQARRDAALGPGAAPGVTSMASPSSLHPRERTNAPEPPWGKQNSRVCAWGRRTTKSNRAARPRAERSSAPRREEPAG